MAKQHDRHNQYAKDGRNGIVGSTYGPNVIRLAGH